MDRRELLQKRWGDLKKACYAQHEEEMAGKAGGDAMCICGHGCGGCGACAMLSEITSFIRCVPAKGMTKEWRDAVELLRSVMH